MKPPTTDSKKQKDLSHQKKNRKTSGKIFCGPQKQRVLEAARLTQHFNRQEIITTVKHVVGSVMVWVSFSALGFGVQPMGTINSAL